MSEYEDYLAETIASDPEKYRYHLEKDVEVAHSLALKEAPTRELANKYGQAGLPATKRYIADRALIATIQDQFIRYGTITAEELHDEMLYHDLIITRLSRAAYDEKIDPQSSKRLRSFEAQQEQAAKLAAQAAEQEAQANLIDQFRGEHSSLPEPSPDLYEPVLLTEPGSFVKKDDVYKPIETALRNKRDESPGKGYTYMGTEKYAVGIAESLLYKFHGTVGEVSMVELPVDQEWFNAFFKTKQQDAIILGTVKRLRFSAVLRPGAGQRISQVDTALYVIKHQDGTYVKKITNRKADRLTALQQAEQVQRESIERARLLEGLALQKPISAGLPTLGER